MAEASQVVVAATWMCRDGDAVLAVRPHGSDVFFLPGGVPEAGESLSEAVAREVNEEVGVLVRANDLREVVRVEDAAHGRPGWTVRLICFEGPGTGDPVAGADEIAEVRWLGPQQWTFFASAVRKALGDLGYG